MLGSITPNNVHLALFGIIAGLFIALVIIELLSGRCLSHRAFHRIYSRTEDAGEFWFNVSLQVAVIGFFSWLYFVKLAQPNATPIP